MHDNSFAIGAQHQQLILTTRRRDTTALTIKGLKILGYAHRHRFALAFSGLSAGRLPDGATGLGKRDFGGLFCHPTAQFIGVLIRRQIQLAIPGIQRTHPSLLTAIAHPRHYHLPKQGFELALSSLPAMGAHLSICPHNRAVIRFFAVPTVEMALI
jgi:hypothetical protein